MHRNHENDSGRAFPFAPIPDEYQNMVGGTAAQMGAAPQSPVAIFSPADAGPMQSSMRPDHGRKLMLSPALRWIAAIFLVISPQRTFAADPGLITIQSRYSAGDTIQRFEAAIRASSDQGWMLFGELDHAAAAKQNGLMLQPRTVIVFGNPRGGTPNMQKAPTLAIDLPTKALVWEDEQGKVWLTFNSGEYMQDQVYARHGLPSNPAAAKLFNEFVQHAATQATE